MTTETRTAYPEDAAREIAEALNATGEVRATADDYEVRVGRQLSKGYQHMGKIEVTIDEDEHGDEYLVLENRVSRRSSWVGKIARDVIARHNR
jgi:hypothetical protein